MLGRRYYPGTYGSTPALYAPSSWNPFRGVLGRSLMLAGLVVIANMVAPQALEHALPHWRTQYGTLIAVAVILGFIRSILRMFLPLTALGFWIVALFALTQASIPTSFTLPGMPSLVAQSSTTTAAPLVAATSTKPIHGTPSLPDSAYFPAPRREGLGALAKIPGVSWLKKSFR
jgi:hypothetical protein